MTFLQVSFYFFAAVLVCAAAMVITVRNPVKAALFLVLAFFSGACIWMTLEAEFLAIVLILVYVGAVMVLFLFVVMMLDINLSRLREGFGEYLPIGGLVAVLMVLEVSIVLAGESFSEQSMPRPQAASADYSNTRDLGRVLYTDYVYAFEIAAVILLVAIIAGISQPQRDGAEDGHVAHGEGLVQHPVEHVREERVRLVKMPATPRHEDDRR